MAISPETAAEPPRDSAAYGALRVQALDALARSAPAPVLPQALAADLRTWAAGIVASAHGPLRGLADAEVPERWRAILAWAGVPMSPSGALRWGLDIDEDAAVATPRLRDGHLTLPTPESLEQLTSLALKPLRLFVAHHFACRLQAATGIYVYLWANQAALISCVSVPVGGFLYGPEAGQRHAVSIQPGGCQVLVW